MRIPDVFQPRHQPAISFEVFPPKTDKGMEKLERLLPLLIAEKPSYMTVTYGAMGTTQSRTLEIARKIQTEYHLDAACHLTCVNASRDQMEKILEEIYDAGIRQIVALRGDPPKGEETFNPPQDGYAHANELVAHIRRFDSAPGRERFGVAVAGYPEKHLEATDAKDDLKWLKNKVNAGADAVITQLFFDNRDFFSFDEDCKKVGIDVPIVPGLMPILDAKQIKMITGMCGSKIPVELHDQLEAAVDDPEAATELGVRHCTRQAIELLERGVPGIHFYVLNRAEPMQRIMGALRERGLLEKRTSSHA